MTDNGQAIKRIEAAEEEIRQAKAILSKPERIKVPDCIDIRREDGETRLLFNDKKQCLSQLKGCYYVQVYTMGYTAADNLYLEPCKREDLKPGDVAYMSENSETAFDSHAYYHCMLDNNEYAWIDGGDVKVRSTGYTYCWKVVK